jgi:hypothetical protein
MTGSTADESGMELPLDLVTCGGTRKITQRLTRRIPDRSSFKWSTRCSQVVARRTATRGKLSILSSWSQNCPFFDSDKKEISVIAAANDPNISGCVIDFSLWCTSRFPEDVDLDAVTTLGQPTCSIFDFDVTLLSGDIIVDPYMLVSADLVSSFFVDVLFTNISSHLVHRFFFVLGGVCRNRDPQRWPELWQQLETTNCSQLPGCCVRFHKGTGRRNSRSLRHPVQHWSNLHIFHVPASAAHLAIIAGVFGKVYQRSAAAHPP